MPSFVEYCCLTRDRYLCFKYNLHHLSQLGGLSIDELKAQRDGGSGIMDTYSKKESGRRSSREQQVRHSEP